MRKPAPDDQCICGTPRFRHREGDDSCDTFRTKATYSVLVRAIIDAGYPNRMFVPTSLSSDVLEIISRQSVFMFNDPPSLLGAVIHIDDKLPENEIALGFGETRPLRERLILA